MSTNNNNDSPFIQMNDTTYVNKNNVVEIVFHQYDNDKCGLTLRTNHTIQQHYINDNAMCTWKGTCDDIRIFRDKFLKK